MRSCVHHLSPFLLHCLSGSPSSAEESPLDSESINSFDYICEAADANICTFVQEGITDSRTICLLASRLVLIFCSAA